MPGGEKMNSSDSSTRPTYGNILPYFVSCSIIILYVAYIATYGVNVPYWDEWQIVPLFQKFYYGNLHFFELLTAKHNEHLVFVSFSFMLLQDLITGFNTKSLLYTSAILQISSFLILSKIAWNLLAKNQLRPWLFVFMAIAIFSISQHKNTLWAFQTAWYLITFLFAASLFVLEKTYSSSNKYFQIRLTIAATLLAALASFCSFQGLIVWAAGAVFIFAKNDLSFSQLRRDRNAYIWLVCASITLAVFSAIWLRDANQPPLFNGSLIARLGTSLYITVGTLGAAVGEAGSRIVMLSGGLYVLLLIGALVKIQRSSHRSEYATPLALVSFGLIFGLLVGLGRAPFGTSIVNETRYGAYALLSTIGLVIIYFHKQSTGNDLLLSVLRKILLGYIVFSGAISGYCGLVKAIEWRTDQQIAAMLLKRYHQTSDFQIKRVLFGDSSFVRANADFLASHSLNLFSETTPGVPTNISAYATPPTSFVDVIERFPEDKIAINKLWDAYLIAGDLQRAFDVTSDDFAFKLMKWTSGATKDGGHYVGDYLKEYSNEYARISEALSKP